ncbi:ABC transporter permease [Methylocella sp.]|uniref:ABC transporter permease n=1 Tax=Methylocella sp. TaxID=1978226 RepID=UPI0035B4F858
MTSAVLRRSLSSRIELQLRIVALLALREIRMKFHESRLSYMLAVAEPAMQIAVIFFIFWAMDRQPDFGTSVFLFLITGFIPYLLFTNISSACAGSIRAARGFRHLPSVNPLDIVFARGLLEFLTHALVFFFVLVIMWICGIPDARAVYPDVAFAAVLASGFLGISVGLLNAVIAHFFLSWRVIYGVLTRSLLFISAVFYVPDYIPQQARVVIAWNPVLHAIEWFRTAFYMTYPASVLDKGYLLTFSAVCLTIGLAAERLIRAQDAAA